MFPRALPEPAAALRATPAGFGRAGPRRLPPFTGPIAASAHRHAVSHGDRPMRESGTVAPWRTIGHDIGQ
jgi:hypothetical protein